MSVLSSSLAIFRISNSGGPQSSPFNSFTLRRSHLFEDEETTYFAYQGEFPAISWKNEFDRVYLDGAKAPGPVSFAFGNNKKSGLWHAAQAWLAQTEKFKGKRLVHAHSPSRGLEAALIFKILSPDTPVFSTIHNHALNFTIRQKVKIVLTCLIASRTVFVSKSAYRSFHKIIPGFAKRKCVIIQNGVDIARVEKALAESTTEKTHRGNTFRCVTIGRHVRQKNRPLLFQALQNTSSSLTLTIFGGGANIEKLQTDIHNFGIEQKTILKGSTERDALLSALTQYNAFVSTSLWEGLPVALMEAMAIGLPCIVSDIPAHREVGDDAGGVFFATTVNDFLEALQKMETAEAGQRKRWGELNREHMKNHFPMERMQNEYRESYERVLKW